MCGRFELSETPLHLVAARLGVEMDPGARALDRRRFNIAPGQQFACMTGARDLTVLSARWGIAGRDGGQRINARVETLRPVWLKSLRRARGLIPADGFVEWKRQGGRRRDPFHLRSRDGMLWLAAVIDLGVADVSSAPQGVVVTCEAVGRAASLHGRMPLMFTSCERGRAWMEDGRYDRGALTRVATELEVARISTRINSASHDDPECLAAAPEEGSSQLDLFGASGGGKS